MLFAVLGENDDIIQIYKVGLPRIIVEYYFEKVLERREGVYKPAGHLVKPVRSRMAGDGGPTFIYFCQLNLLIP